MWAERSGTPTDLSRYQTRVWTESSQSWKTPTYYGAGRMRAKHKHTDNHTALAQSCSFITSSLMECEIHSGWSSEDGIFDKEPTPPSSKSLRRLRNIDATSPALSLFAIDKVIVSKWPDPIIYCCFCIWKKGGASNTTASFVTLPRATSSALSRTR